VQTVAEKFKKDKFVYLGNAINPKQASELSNLLIKAHEQGHSKKDTQCPESDSFYNFPALTTVLHRLAEPLSHALETELKPTYVYARLYRPGQELKPHIDRKECEISATMTLGHAEDSDIWPIYMGKDKTDTVGTPITIDVGGMVLYHGCDLRHWRTAYRGEWQTQVFFHYIKKGGVHDVE